MKILNYSLDADGCIYNRSYHLSYLKLFITFYDDIFCLEAGDTIDKQILIPKIKTMIDDPAFCANYNEAQEAEVIQTLKTAKFINDLNAKEDDIRDVMKQRCRQFLQYLDPNLDKKILINTNQQLLTAIQRNANANNYDKIILTVGSLRQSPYMDAYSQEYCGTGLIYEDLPVIAASLASSCNIPVEHHAFSMAAIYEPAVAAAKSAGHHFSYASGWLPDPSKFSIWYATANQLAAEYPHAQIDCVFVDDLLELLEELTDVCQHEDARIFFPLQTRIFSQRYNGIISDMRFCLQGANSVDPHIGQTLIDHLLEKNLLNTTQEEYDFLLTFFELSHSEINSFDSDSLEDDAASEAFESEDSDSEISFQEPASKINSFSIFKKAMSQSQDARELAVRLNL